MANFEKNEYSHRVLPLGAVMRGYEIIYTDIFKPQLQRKVQPFNNTSEELLYSTIPLAAI
jgi:hypothetical protein